MLNGTDAQQAWSPVCELRDKLFRRFSSQERPCSVAVCVCARVCTRVLILGNSTAWLTPVLKPRRWCSLVKPLSAKTEKLNPQDSHGERKEMTSVSCPLTSNFLTFFLWGGGQVSPCSPWWPWTHRELPASVFQMLQLKVCANTVQLWALIFNSLDKRPRT